METQEKTEQERVLEAAISWGMDVSLLQVFISRMGLHSSTLYAYAEDYITVKLDQEWKRERTRVYV